MRREKIVEIDGRAIIVRELKTSDVITLLETQEGMQVCIGLISGLPQDIRKVMMLSVDLTPEEFDTITEGINSYTILEQAVREVNADFFASLPQRMQTLTTSAQLLAKTFGVFSSGHVGLSRKDT